ncbi:transcription termination factor MTEF18, mitochondrial-like [Typha angustifolia]|uniref:transcription termination factor MTEF18, mitochondrial-like n=1 Tax=Typha angustifolia TaxID=59011 RepID=UPI003C2FC0B7
MIPWRKLARPSFFRWVSRLGAEELWRSSKIPTFRTGVSFCRPKILSFHLGRGRYIKEPSFPNWVSPFSSRGSIFAHKSTGYWVEMSGLFNARCFCAETNSVVSQATARIHDQEALMEPSNGVRRSTRAVVEAQNALMDYLHGTRNLNFTDAEHMCKHSPIFLGKLLNKVEKEEDIGKGLTRFFRYHPINEFEPFFESIGLKPSEFNPLLPRNLMFLSDDEEFLENFHVLCNYGIARSKIGKIYREATGIFRYKLGILDMKLQAYEGLGLSKSTVIKIVASSPILLVGDINREFVKVIEWLDGLGIKRDWIGSVLSEKNFYNWSRMLVLLEFFTELGFSKESLGDLIRWHPDLMLDGSGKMLFSVVVLLMKLGGRRKELFDLFSHFPNIQIGNFMRNMRKGMLFLIDIGMSPEDVEKLFITHPEIIGSCSLKKPNSIQTYLNVGKKRLCRIIKEDPHQLERYTFGTKLSRLPNSGEDERSLRAKTKFLSRIGFIEDSEDMKKALKLFRGKGDELQDRYGFLVKTGFEPDDVARMIKRAPQVLNQKIDVLESKISFLVNNIGYPLNSLVNFPGYMAYTLRRVKLRFLMYNWLKERGKAKPSLALSSVLACSDKAFTKKFVNQDPDGPEVWENFKKELHSN